MYRSFGEGQLVVVQIFQSLHNIKYHQFVSIITNLLRKVENEEPGGWNEFSKILIFA